MILINIYNYINIIINIHMMIVRDAQMGAEEAICGLSRLYRIFQAKGSLSDGTLERPKWRRRRNT